MPYRCTGTRLKGLQGLRNTTFPWRNWEGLPNVILSPFGPINECPGSFECECDAIWVSSLTEEGRSFSERAHNAFERGLVSISGASISGPTVRGISCVG